MITNPQSGTNVHEIAHGIYRINTPVDLPDGQAFSFNQYLVLDDDPLLFHTGPRQLFPLVSQAVATLMPLERLRWVALSHTEADECGSMNQWLAAAPDAQVAHGQLGCAVSLNDLADRPPRPLTDGEVLDIGGHRLRQIPTPHVPHNWEAQLLFDEVTGTLFCGDLFTQVGPNPPLVHDADLISPALAAEDLFQATAPSVATAPTIRALADLAPRTLALMHGPTATGDCPAALHDLADGYAARVLDLAG